MRALGHPLRQDLLKEMYGKEEVSPRELSQRMGAQLSTVSYHVRVLAECEAISPVRTRPVRGSMQHFYRFAIEARWAYEALGISPLPSSEN
jgi:DNA-binding transcriptional ArsR family regulator